MDVETETNHEMLQRVGHNLRPLGGDGRVAILGGPFGRIDDQSLIEGHAEPFLMEDGREHGKSVLDHGLAQEKRSHEAGREDRGVASVAEAQGPLERRDKLQPERATVLVHGGGDLLRGVQHFYERRDGIRDPLVQIWEHLREGKQEGSDEMTWDGMRRDSVNKRTETWGGTKDGRRTEGLSTTKYWLTYFRMSGFLHSCVSGRMICRKMVLLEGETGSS